MDKFVKAILLFGVCVSLACGCNRSDKPMPLTKENMTTYMQTVEATLKSTNPKEVEEARGNPAREKELFHRSVVEPMEKMGYSYDKTIGDIANKVLARNLRTTDIDLTITVSDTLAFAKNMRESAYQYGFISKETKELLDRVSLIFPR